MTAAEEPAPTRRGALAAILLVSLGLKLALLVPAHAVVPARDSADYVQAAAHLDRTGRYDSIRPPLFPFTLLGARKIAAAVGWNARWFGPVGQAPPGPTHLDVARVLTVLMSTVSVFLVFGLARDLFDERAGLAAAALCAFYPNFVGYSHLLWADTQLATFHLAFAWLLVAGLRRTSGPLVFASGVALGLAALTRQVVLSFAVVPLLWFWLMRPDAPARALRAGGLVLLGTLVAVAPWTIRNASELGRFVPVSAISGTTLLFGVTDNWEGELHRANITPPIDPAKDQRAGDVAAELIRQDPLAYARRVLFVNTTKLWGVGSMVVETAYQPWGYGDFPRRWGRPLMLAIGASYVLVVCLGLAGIALAPRWRESLLVGGIVLHAVAVHSLFGSMHRHRFYLMPYFMTYAGFLASRSRHELRALLTPGRLRVAVALLALFAVLLAGAPWRRVGWEWRAFGGEPPTASAPIGKG